MTETIERHPVQQRVDPHSRDHAFVPAIVTLRAYEVYCHLYGEQPAMVTDGCRGGFSVGELLAFLYARTFPKEEWRQRCEQAQRGMTVI